MRQRSILALIAIVTLLNGCKSYNHILENIYDKDQSVREWTVGMASLSADEIAEYSYEMARTDSLNQTTVFDILDKEGWPSHLSDKANNQYGGSIGSSTTRSNYGGGYTTNYYNQYGGNTGSATTNSNYGGGVTTNYYNQYGGSTGSATTRSNYGGGTTTNYYDKYGGSISSSTTRENYGGGTTTTYYDAYGNNIGSSNNW